MSWRSVFNKPTQYTGTELTAWEFIRDCLLSDKPIPRYFYPHPIVPSKKLMRQIKNAVGNTKIEVRVIDLHFDGHNGDHLLIYCRVPEAKIVVLIDIGTHSELFS